MTRSTDVRLGTPDRKSRVKRTSEQGRHCDHPGCPTVLSTYNASSTCWTHTVPTSRHPLARD